MTGSELNMRALMLGRIRTHVTMNEGREAAIDAEAETVSMYTSQLEAYMLLVTKAKLPMHYWTAANLVKRCPPSKLFACCSTLCDPFIPMR